MRLRKLSLGTPGSGSGDIGQVIPSGTLKRLTIEQINPSRNNPRHLFDPEPLQDLKESIRLHGVLVPITVYQPKGQSKYSILDGERRYRCCVALAQEGEELDIPANIVEPPNKLAGLLYMFSIHNFREAWELMPTALSLQIVMQETGENDSKRLSELTGLSDPQVKRCKMLLAYPEHFQAMSLDPDPSSRIPSNFWIEAYPVLEVCANDLPDLVAELGRDGITEQLVAKYRAGKIKSVIHFRRILEGYEDPIRRADVVARLREFIVDIQLETRKAFDEFVEENQKIQATKDACSTFLKQVQRIKIDHIVDRSEVTKALEEVRDFADQLLQQLSGSDAPPAETNEAEE